MTPEEVAAAQKLADATKLKQPIVLQGDAKNGGPFTIHGEGFGIEKGTLTIGGRAIKITSWADGRIKGETPKGVIGDVVLVTSSGTRTGKFPTPKV